LTTTGESVLATDWLLEGIKLGVSLITPGLVAYLAWQATSLSKRLEEQYWSSRTIVEWRIKVYDEVAPLLNDLLCYFTFVGNWKTLSPLQVIDLKRTLDKKMHTVAPLFSPEFLACYFEFNHACFLTYQGWGVDAKIRSPMNRHKEFFPQWDSDWNELFAKDSECETPSLVREKYMLLMQDFASELGLGLTKKAPPAGIPPSNV
jgi:hypothetical protein